MADEVKGAGNRNTSRAKDATDKVSDAAREAADRMRAGAEQARESFQEHFVEPAKRAGEAMKASGQRVAEGGSTIGRKMIDQAEANAHEAFTAMRAAASAKDISEVLKIQGEYLREQGQRSMSQAREIGELIMQFGRDAVAPMCDAADKK